MANSVLKKEPVRLHTKHSSGVTLVELLIVMGIISFLSVIGLYSFRSQIFKGKDAKRKADVKRIATAVEEYYADNDCYPTPDLVSCDPGNTLQPYLQQVPCDPTTKKTYLYETPVSACPSWWRFTATLEHTQEPFILESPNSP